MGLSPFHGIFSAFSEQADLPAVASAQNVPPVSAVSKLPNETVKPSVGQIAVDIYEHDGYYIIRAPIAGVRLADLDIEVDGRIVTIRGARKLSDDIPQAQYYLQECYWGQFSRSITLPMEVDARKIKATFTKDSILKILIPKEDRIKIVRVSEA